jgi:hypothetical protein
MLVNRLSAAGRGGVAFRLLACSGFRGPRRKDQSANNSIAGKMKAISGRERHGANDGG